MMSRVLVTGAAGFIGSHLVDALLGRGVRVVGLDRRRVGEHALADENLAEAVGSPLFTPYCLDLAVDQLDDLVAGCDTVFHLAARPGVRPSWSRESLDYTQTNVLGTHRLLEARTRQGYAGWSSPRRRASPVRPTGPAATKTPPARSPPTG
ncbi:hypothetical protein BSA16_07500 [Micromonospora sp. Rc5]|nr:NAD(P)-dependent oxidoreductase [Micromonospora sp. Rc5]MDI5936734.1 NAD(P)-dependent oxidoreductase [Micromonospora sp. DH15]OON32097.1 hypothetical protein BSA16_07500 [Micromonospora sp. Rc5]